LLRQAHEGRINATSVMLEGSRHASNGMRVEVDLTNIKESKQSYSLFPGQIVAIEGINTSGRKLLAQRICEGAAHPPEQTSVHDLMKYHHDAQEGSPLQLLAACGPFTSSDNLEYEPLFEFLVKVKEHQPDVVILMGPFVDMRHKRVSSGRTTLQDEDGNEILVTCEVLFMNKVSLLLTDFYDEHPTSRTQFVIVPSMEDATASWVYPQAPFYDHRQDGNTQLEIPGSEGIEVGTLGLKDGSFAANGRSRVHCVSNPCTLRINEVTIGVTSSDVLFGLSSEETNANLEPGSRLARLGQHMLQQQSYYPLYPPSSKANLNLKFAEQWKIPCGLDFLIVPSMLFPFARSVLDNKTIVVNPGLLTKDTGGGSYAIFDVHPIDRSALEGIGEASVKIEHQIVDRTMIEIRKV
jgi:DNA polymerase alpha subunit B